MYAAMYVHMPSSPHMTSVLCTAFWWLLNSGFNQLSLSCSPIAHTINPTQSHDDNHENESSHAHAVIIQRYQYVSSSLSNSTYCHMDMKCFLYCKQCTTYIYTDIIMSEVKTYCRDRFCAVNATKVPHFVDFRHYLHHNCL